MRTEPTFLDSMRIVGDPVGDEVIQSLFADRRIDDTNAFFRRLVSNQGLSLSEEAPEPLRAYLELTAVLPPWADEARIARSGDFFDRHGPQIMTVLGAYSLPLDYAARKGVQVLARTARMTRNPNRRVLETAQMITALMQPGGLSPSGGGLRCLQKVRLIHAAVRHLIRSRDMTWRAEYGTPINQEDQAGTLMSFSYAVLDGLARLGVPPTEDEADAYLHTWCVAGYVLGIHRDLLPRSMAEARLLSETIRRRQHAPCEEGRELTRAMLRMMDGSFPWTMTGFGATLMRHLLGDDTADLLAVPASTWSNEQLFALQQRLAVGIEAAADRDALMRGIQRALSRAYLEHMWIIDRGPGEPGLRLPERLSRRWELGARPAAPGGLAVPRVVDARAVLHPVERNNRINGSYHEMSEAMGRFLGEPRVADWCSFAKFASHQAGQRIRETSLTAVEFMRNLLDRSEPGKLKRLVEDLLRMPARLSMGRLLLSLSLRRAEAGISVEEVSQRHGARLLPALCDLRGAAARLNRSFVLGNLRIYENIAPAYAAFLEAARDAPDWLPREAPAFSGDEHGYLRRAFGSYLEARRLSLAGQTEARDQRVHEGNLWIGIHEQGQILQPLFEEIREELRALAGSIYFSDGGEEDHRMLPDGDWGDFFARMGLEIRPQPFRELPPLRAGVTGEAVTTIGAYFLRGLHDCRLMEKRPDDLLPIGKDLQLLDEERDLD